MIDDYHTPQDYFYQIVSVFITYYNVLLYSPAALNWTPALGLRLQYPLCEESVAIEKLFEDVPRRDRVFLDAAFEHVVDQVVSEPGVFAPFCGQKGEEE